jgi:hypothetical protein
MPFRPRRRWPQRHNGRSEHPADVRARQVAEADAYHARMEREERECLARWKAQDDARRAKLTPEQLEREDHERAEMQQRIADAAATRAAAAADRLRREREQRDDPYWTRGT